MDEPRSFLRLRNVGKVFPASHGRVPLHAVGPLDLELTRGEFFAVVGPSGCGKSTLLELIAGLTPASEGSLEFEGKPIAGEAPEGIGVVFQDDASLPGSTSPTTSPSDCAGRASAVRKERARARRAQPGRPRRFRHQLSRAALGRHAPAGVHRAHAGHAADVDPPGRAVRCARPANARC